MLINSTALFAPTICAIYKNRWQPGLFFRRVTQHVCIKHLLGNSLNATETQAGCAIANYTHTAIAKNTFQLGASLSSGLRSCRSQFWRKPSSHAPLKPIRLYPIRLMRLIS